MTEKVQPTVAAGRAQAGEVVVAYLRGDAVAAAVPRAGVIHTDSGRRLQAGPRHLAALGHEAALAIDQQAHD